MLALPVSMYMYPMEKLLAERWKTGLLYILCFTGMLWAIEGINQAMGHALNLLGILPRRGEGVSGILLWPLLHGNWSHLMVNTVPFLVLGWFVAIRGGRIFMRVTLTITLVTGVCVWVFGRQAYHLGASGLVFGYFGFLIYRGIFERSLSALIVASLTIFYYGGMVVGVLPTAENISWETHLFGLLSGILAARAIPLDSNQIGT
jgi:membrane associated rhomboid family serine protease